MTELNIEKFNPKIEELQILAANAKGITLADLTDKAGLKIVRESRLALRAARIEITKTGKEMRQSALDFQRDVIAREKELVAIVEPEELRLAGIEEAAEKLQEREARRELLPRRKERLAAIGDEPSISEDELLDMDGAAFEGYYNKRVADHNEKIRLANEAKARELNAAADELKRKKDLAEAEERGRIQAEEKRKREAKEKEDREKAEEVKRAKDARYQEFLKKHNFDPKDSIVSASGDKIIMWRKVAEFDPNSTI